MSGSIVETVKEASRLLRGSLGAELLDGTDVFSADSTHLLKFHGIYQQDDRDVRRARTAKRLGLDYSCMVRTSVPCGIGTTSGVATHRSFSTRTGPRAT